MTASTQKPPLVIGFVGENANGCLEASTRHLNTLLSSFGIEAHCINLFDPDWSTTLGKLVSDRTPHFCYGYAGVGAALLNGENSFWTDYKTPFLSFMYDHPFSNLRHHTVDSPYVVNGYFIADFLEVQQDYVQHKHPSILLRDRIAHTTSTAEPVTKAEHQARWRARPIPYLFIKTGNDPARLEPEIKTLNAVEREIFYTCLSLLKNSANYHLTHLVAEHCRAQQIEPRADNRRFTKIVLLLERYVRDWRSRQVVEWLKNKPAVIVGDGWDSVDKTNAVAKFLPSAPATE